MSTTRERSSRYVSVEAPAMQPCSSYCTATDLPKRDELSFRIVFAFPNASRIGDASRSSSSTDTTAGCSATPTAGEKKAASGAGVVAARLAWRAREAGVRNDAVRDSATAASGVEGISSEARVEAAATDDSMDWRFESSTDRIEPRASLAVRDAAVRNSITRLAASVLPAPDSPEMRTDCEANAPLAAAAARSASAAASSSAPPEASRRHERRSGRISRQREIAPATSPPHAVMAE
mmetsp:Transcript_38801/g.124553  ORF Transcript_38801/g.124553 Transcript_38801/m.124553 type:complete len:236 (-) Transcript_38801:129-836(-)